MLYFKDIGRKDKHFIVSQIFKIFLTTNKKYLNNEWECIYDKKTKKKRLKINLHLKKL